LKKQVSILLLILILNIPFIGFFAYYQISKLQIKEIVELEIKNGALKSEIIELEFNRTQTDNNLTWLSNREFKYSDLVYQVIKVKYSGDKIIYFCRINSETNDLLKNIDNLVLKTMGTNHDTQKAADNFGNFLNSLFFNEVDNILVSFFKVSDFSFSFLNSEYKSNCIECVGPPPKA